jgi:hypothetical protein
MRERWPTVAHISSAARFFCRHTVARCSSNALNVLGAVLGRAWVEEKAKTKIPAEKTYKLAWVSPRWAGGTVKVCFSFKTARAPANSPG